MSSDSAITLPFQVAVVISGESPAAAVYSGSPAQRVGGPGLRGVAGPAVAPRHDPQRLRRLPALGALDGLVPPGAGVADLPRPFLVDGLVALARAAEVGFGASSSLDRNGVPPGGRRTCTLP